MPKRRQAPNPSGRAQKATKLSTKGTVTTRNLASRPPSESHVSESVRHLPKTDSLAAKLRIILPDKEELKQVVATHTSLVGKAIEKAVPQLGLHLSNTIASYAVSRIDIVNEKGTVQEFAWVEDMARYFLCYIDLNERIKLISKAVQRHNNRNQTAELHTTVIDEFRPLLNRMFLSKAEVKSDFPYVEYEIRPSYQSTHCVTPSLEHCKVYIIVSRDILSVSVMVEAYWMRDKKPLVARVPFLTGGSLLAVPRLSFAVFTRLEALLSLPRWLSPADFVAMLVCAIDKQYLPDFQLVQEISDATSLPFDRFGLFGSPYTPPVAPRPLATVSTDHNEITRTLIDLTGASAVELRAPSTGAAVITSAGISSEPIDLTEETEPKKPSAKHTVSEAVPIDIDEEPEDEEVYVFNNYAQMEQIENTWKHKRPTMAERMLRKLQESDPIAQHRKTQSAVQEFLPAEAVSAIVADYAFDFTETIDHLGSFVLLGRISESAAEYAAYSLLVDEVCAVAPEFIPMVNRLYVEEVRPEYRATNYLLVAPPIEGDTISTTPKPSSPEQVYDNCLAVISIMFDLKRWRIPCIQVSFNPDPLRLSGHLITVEGRPKPQICRVLGRRLHVPETLNPSEWVSVLTCVTPSPWDFDPIPDAPGSPSRVLEAEVRPSPKRTLLGIVDGKEVYYEDLGAAEGPGEEEFDEEEIGSGCRLDRSRKTRRWRGPSTWVEARSNMM